MVVRRPLPTRDSYGAWFMDTNETPIRSAMAPGIEDLGVIASVYPARTIVSVSNNGGQAVFNAPGHQISNGTSIQIAGTTSYNSASLTASNVVTSTSFETGQAYVADETGQVYDLRGYSLPPAVAVSQVGVPFSYARNFVSTDGSYCGVLDNSRNWHQKIDNALYFSYTLDFWISFSELTPAAEYNGIFSCYEFRSGPKYYGFIIAHKNDGHLWYFSPDFWDGSTWSWKDMFDLTTLSTDTFYHFRWQQGPTSGITTTPYSKLPVSLWVNDQRVYYAERDYEIAGYGTPRISVSGWSSTKGSSVLYHPWQSGKIAHLRYGNGYLPYSDLYNFFNAVSDPTDGF